MRRPRAALYLVVAVVVPLAFSPLSAAGIGSDKDLYRASVATAAEQVRTDDAALARIRAAGRESLRAGVQDVYRNVESRVPEYGDWVYGWLTSLWTSAEIAAVAVTGVATALADGAEPPLDRAERLVTESVHASFEEIVLRPDETRAQLQDRWSRAISLTQATAVGTRLQLPLPPPFPGDRIDQELADARSETVLVRTVRPMGARVLSLAVRFGTATSLGAMAAPSVAASSAIADYILTSVIAAGAVWGADWSVNAIDSALHRDAFEDELRQSVHLQAVETERRLEAALDQWIDGATLGAGPEGDAPKVIRIKTGATSNILSGTR